MLRTSQDATRTAKAEKVAVGSVVARQTRRRTVEHVDEDGRNAEYATRHGTTPFDSVLCLPFTDPDSWRRR